MRDVSLLYLLTAIITLATVYLLIRVLVALRLSSKLRGQRLVTCPETEKAARVRIAAGHAAMDALVGRRRLRLSDCSRWPERRNCEQDCLSQIEAAPEDCLVWNIVSRWSPYHYKKKCHKPFKQMNHIDHRPALMNVDLKTVEWDEIVAEKLPEVLASHWPVRWNCHIAQTFWREHP